MKRVAALYLPSWPIDRLRRAERTVAPPEAGASASLEPLREAAAEEQQHACSVPRGGGWRPGARWAREEQQLLPEFGSGRRTIREANGGGAADLSRRTSPAAPPPSFGRSPSPSKLGEELAPLVTSLRQGNRLLIGAASPEAHALGLRAGMALTQARAQVPGLDIRPADPEGDLADLRRMAIAFARRWSPQVALSDTDGLFIELTGVAHLFGGEAAMARRIARLLAKLGVQARIAVADTAGAVWALARWRGDAVTVCPPGGHRDALAPLPPEALRIAPEAVELLQRFGVERIGTLAAMPRGPLVRRFGSALVERLDQALGHLPEPLDFVVPPEAIAVVRRFAEPIQTAEAIAHWLGLLVPQLTQALEQAGQGARAVELVAERVDGVPQRIRIGLARASRDPLHLIRLIARRIDTIEPGYGIDALALHVRRAEPLGPRPVEERLDEEVAPDLAPLVDALATQIGMERLWRSRPVESDVPERSVARAAVLDPPPAREPRLKIDDVRRLAPGDAPVWRPDWPRPARLLARPERVDGVMAEMPDQPPRRFTWRGVTHRVVRADGPERIQGEWWKRLSEVHSVRDYFRVEDEQGRRYWLFRRGDGERKVTGDLSWYLHGVFG